MKLQSAIEFLTTYGFLFLIIGIMISILIFFAIIPQNTVPSQCSSYAGLGCQFVSFYSNTIDRYSLVGIVLSNSQSVPVNINNLSVQAKGVSGIGTCTPNYLEPGQSTSCLAKLPLSFSYGTLVQGFYVANGGICNSATNTGSNCLGDLANVTYGGSFTTSVEKTNPKIYSIVVAQSPSNIHLAPYSSSPVIPNSFTILDNGQVSSLDGGFAYGSNYYSGNTYAGYALRSFPSSISELSNNAISCSASSAFNSMFSIAYTTLYVPTASNPVANAVSDNAIEIYYRVPNTINPNSAAWSNVLNAAYWTQASTPQFTGTHAIPIGTNTLQIAIAWTNTCAQPLEAFSINNIE